MRFAFVAVMFSLAGAAAGAATLLPGIAARAEPRGLNMDLTVPQERLCAGELQPDPWRDASDAHFFATGPTARLDAQELAAGSIVPLVSVKVALALAVPRLQVLGMPATTGLHFTTAGWRARWPFC